MALTHVHDCIRALSGSALVEVQADFVGTLRTHRGEGATGPIFDNRILDPILTRRSRNQKE